MRRSCVLSIALLLTGALASVATGQVPQPFPRPAAPRPGDTTPAPAQPPAAPTPTTSAQPSSSEAPGEALLGVPIYPNARFIASYDAGQGQRYYLFGSNASFTDLVAYYRTVLKNRGELLYEEPPIHMFDTGRFREESMAFPPSVTVKDYTWGGVKGYLVPLPGGKSQRYPTVIQIVPVPTADRR